MASALLLAALWVPAYLSFEPATQAAFDAYSYIPPGSKISDPAKDVMFADLDGDGIDEAIIFYLARAGKFVMPSIKVLKKWGNGWQDIWRTSANVGWDFIKPSGVYDMLKVGRPQIISYISVGASCGGLLDIYQFDPLYGTIKSLDGWPKQSCAHNLKFKDLDGDGIPEIVFTETNYSTIPHIYWWNGERFVLSDSNFPRYYDPELHRLVHDALLPDSPGREMSARMAFKIYMLQRRYRGAIDFCQRLLRITKGREQAAGAGMGETSSIDAREAIYHRWMGEAYKSLNQLAEARSEVEKARDLDLMAKRLDPHHIVPFPLN